MYSTQVCYPCALMHDSQYLPDPSAKHTSLLRTGLPFLVSPSAFLQSNSYLPSLSHSAYLPWISSKRLNTSPALPCSSDLHPRKHSQRVTDNTKGKTSSITSISWIHNDQQVPFHNLARRTESVYPIINLRTTRNSAESASISSNRS